MYTYQVRATLQDNTTTTFETKARCLDDVYERLPGQVVYGQRIKTIDQAWQILT